MSRERSRDMAGANTMGQSGCLRYLAHAIIYLAVVSAVFAQEFSSDTSYVKPRGKLLYIGADPAPVVRLFDLLEDIDAATNPRFGTFLPLSSVAPDSSAEVVVIRHGIDAHSYVIVRPQEREWTILQGEAARVYWAHQAKRVAVVERFLSELEKIRIIDYAGSSAEVYTCPDTIMPADQKNGKHVTFGEVEWSAKDDAIHYTIVTTIDGGTTKKDIRIFSVPKKKKERQQK